MTRDEIKNRQFNWQPIETAPTDQMVWTKIEEDGKDRMIQEMKLSNNLWWAGSMYTYYTPTHWSY